MASTTQAPPGSGSHGGADKHVDLGPNDSTEQAVRFLESLFPGAHDDLLTLWTRQDQQTRKAPLQDHARVAAVAVKLAATCDVYFGTGLRRPDLNGTGRGTKADVTVLPGVWADVDLDDEDAAREALTVFPLAPSVLVWSGHGLHAWWLFDRPWRLETGPERAAADSYIEAFGAIFADVPGVDPAVFELARAMRLPGTWNHKAEPVRVRLVELHADRRYSRAELEAHFPKPEPRRAGSGTRVPPSGEGRSRAERYAAAALVNVAAELASEPESDHNRNFALNTAALKLARISLVCGTPDEAAAWAALWHSCQVNGLGADRVNGGERACRASFDSGWRAGLEAGPAEVPDFDAEPKIAAGDSDGDKGKPSQATQLVALAIGTGAEFWHTPAGVPFVTVPTDGNKVTFPLRSRAFSAWLRRRFYDAKEGKAVGASAVADAVATLEGRALFDCREHEAHVRLAGHEGRVYLDLGGPDWRAVEIDADGWRLVSDPPVKFHRPAGVLPLPEPVVGGDIDGLWRFVHVASDDQPLVLGWLVMACCPTGPYPVLNLLGEHGSGKSTASRVLRGLVDPNTAPLRAAPHDGRDLMIGASNAWAVVFENLSGLQTWLSDALCRLATGGGFATRTLYTDEEETLFEAQRPVILNGISDLAARADLLDRSILVTLPRLPDSDRVSEREFDVQFEASRPALLGCLLDAVSCALRRRDEVHLDRLPRMADAAIWAEAAAPALGLKQGEFLAAYTGNRSAANEVALDSADWWPVLQAELHERGGEWLVAAGDILDALNIRRGDGRAPKGWPATARGLTGQLRRLAPNMRAAGVSVEFNQRISRDSGRGIHLRHDSPPDDGASIDIPVQPSASSASSRNRGQGADWVRSVADDEGQPSAEPSARLTEVADGADRADGTAGTATLASSVVALPRYFCRCGNVFVGESCWNCRQPRSAATPETEQPATDTERAS